MKRIVFFDVFLSLTFLSIAVLCVPERKKKEDCFHCILWREISSCRDRMGNDAGVVQVIVQFDLWERGFEVR